MSVSCYMITCRQCHMDGLVTGILAMESGESGRAEEAVVVDLGRTVHARAVEGDERSRLWPGVAHGAFIGSPGIRR
jgi:hypothetical protein